MRLTTRSSALLCSAFLRTSLGVADLDRSVTWWPDAVNMAAMILLITSFPPETGPTQIFEVKRVCRGVKDDFRTLREARAAFAEEANRASSYSPSAWRLSTVL